MYLEYWGLRDAPFSQGHCPRGFFLSPGHEEALARLHFLADQGGRVGLLTGEAGSGKSLLLAVFASEIGKAGGQAARIPLAGVSRHELLFRLCIGLGQAPSPEAGEFRLWQSACDGIAAARHQGIPLAVLLDDADRASAETSDSIGRLCDVDEMAGSRLTLIAAARSDRLSSLHPRFIERASLIVEVERWSEGDVELFLKQSVERAGRNEPVFDAAAAQQLCRLSGGIPRRVKQLAELALVAGAGRELSVLGADEVAEVYRELAGVAVPV
jgi:general secretion pathway protein A